ncbi:P-loop containing nucleoside triphosphate hydrolase protein, partial [Mycena latifolia]
MPHHSPDMHDTLQYTLVAADALQDLVKAAQIPFLGSVCSLALAIVPLVQNIKSQKEKCVRMVEEIHRALCGLLGLCLNTESTISPQLLESIAQYVQTLQTFHTCLKARQHLGKIKRFFKQSEITLQLDVCERDLENASHILLWTKTGSGFARTIMELRDDMERRHQEVLELISARSGSFETTFSVGPSCSGSFSLLPASPQIFHGRESELNEAIATLVTDPARVAFLGPGGMGKTTLAIAVLYHPAVIEKYSIRHFVTCESANTSGCLVAILGSHLGLGNSAQLPKAIVQHFRQCGPCLLVLDNLETPWEPLESRGAVEEFLSILADVPSLALLITMRGAERPGKVKWNRPFLPPLEPLSLSAARQIFVAVADEPGDEEELALTDLLDVSGSLPLVVSLMANIASFEGYSGTLSRWRLENTSLLSEGHKKHSNLEKSIMLSLSSPRMTSSPHAKDLLSLLALLPDGITEKEIIASQVPIPQISHCRSTLTRTSLAYIDTGGRLKALSPIREYMRTMFPPPLALCKPLRAHFERLLSVWETHQELPSGNLAPGIAASLGNIHELMLQGLAEDRAAWVGIGHSILTLSSFYRTMLKSDSPLMQRVPGLIELTGNLQLKWRYVSTLLDTDTPIEDAEAWITKGVDDSSTRFRSPWRK